MTHRGVQHRREEKQQGYDDVCRGEHRIPFEKRPEGSCEKPFILLKAFETLDCTTKSPLATRGDTRTHIISHLPDFRLPKLAPSSLITVYGPLITDWLPRRHRVGPSASLDEHSTNLSLYIMMGMPCQTKIAGKERPEGFLEKSYRVFMNLRDGVPNFTLSKCNKPYILTQ
jgi:hypothetical protein